MKPSFFNLLSIHQFTGMDHEDNEDPYTHLSTFYELVRTIDFKSSNIWRQKIIIKYSQHLRIRTLKLKIIHINSSHTKLLKESSKYRFLAYL